MTPMHKRTLTQDEARFNALARFADDPRALITQDDKRVRIHFGCNGSRPSRTGSLVDLRYVPKRGKRAKRVKFA